MANAQDKWLEIFHEWGQSGLTRAEYCRTHKLAVSTFDYWRKKTRKKSIVKPELVKVGLKAPNNQDAAITLTLSGGYQLKVPSGYRSEHLKRLLTDIREIQ